MEEKDSWDLDFTLAEILEMESFYKELGEETLDKDFCEKVASNFSCSPNRLGKSSVTWEEVHVWFKEKQMETQNKQPMALKLFVDLSSVDSGKLLEKLPIRQGTIDDIKELSFEARSSRDYAWYDVESFLSYRVLSTGEIEVRVRFSGFAKTEDEWINVITAIRERSIPLEPSECDMVKIGDLVLSYQDREFYQVYYDAHVVDILREKHDDNVCTCVFMVCYDHDYSEEKVNLKRICRRPSMG